MNISSNGWLFVIVIGAVCVAVGNINYNVARDREKGQAASEKALTLLHVEFQNNLNRLSVMRQVITTGAVSTETFETTAWNIVSNGGLLIQVEQDTMGRIAEIYYLIGLADKYQTQLLELSTGMASALQGAAALRQQYLAFLTSELDKLEPKLKDVLARKSGS
jgi:hypothetical protein